MCFGGVLAEKRVSVDKTSVPDFGGADPRISAGHPDLHFER